MEVESYNDGDVARALNDGFISIKSIVKNVLTSTTFIRSASEVMTGGGGGR